MHWADGTLFWLTTALAFSPLHGMSWHDSTSLSATWTFSPQSEQVGLNSAAWTFSLWGELTGLHSASWTFGRCSTQTRTHTKPSQLHSQHSRNIHVTEMLAPVLPSVFREIKTYFQGNTQFFQSKLGTQNGNLNLPSSLHPPPPPPPRSPCWTCASFYYSR